MDANEFAQQNSQDHKRERTELKKRGIQSDNSGNFINKEDATNINRDEEHRLVQGGPRDLVTVLLLKSVRGSQRSRQRVQQAWRQE